MFDFIEAECDVSFAPPSKSLVGSSKREELLSKHAITDVFWNGLNSQDAANNDDVISVSFHITHNLG